MHITHINLAKGFRGGERQTALLIAGLAQRQVKQQLIARHDSPLLKIVDRIPDLTIYPVKKPHIWQLKRRLDTDILHAHEAKAAQWCCLYHLLYPKPYIITRRVPHKPKRNFFTRRVYHQAAALIALSTAIKNILHAYNDQLKIHIIPSIYQEVNRDNKRLEKIRQYYRQNYGKGRTIIGHVGALVDHHKGQSLIIEAARILEHNYPDLLFMLVGDGPDKNTLIQLAAGLSNVCFTGYQSQVADYFALFDYFVFPSFHEGLGSSLLDAVFHKLPVIATRVDGIVDIIQDQKTGLLIEPGRPDQLAEAIVSIMDSNLSNRLVELASSGLARYSADRVSGQYMDVYKRVLESHI